MAPVYRRPQDVFKTYPRKTGETFKAGAVVLRDANGEWAEAGADPASIGGVALVAAADANPVDTFGTVVARVPVALADQEFRGNLKGTYAATDVGASYGLVLDASGYWVVDRAETVNTRVQITGADDEVAVGDVNPPVRFVFLTANRQVIS